MYKEIVVQIQYKQYNVYNKQYNIQCVIYSVIHIILKANLELGVCKD